MLLQLLAGGEYLFERRLPAFVDPETVMQLLRTIDAQPNQKLVLAQKGVPLVVQQRSIGLQVVLDVETRTLIFLFQRHHLLKEAHAQQRGLAARHENTTSSP